MKKTSWLIITLVASVVFLGACSDDENEQSEDPVEDMGTESNVEDKQDDASSKNNDEAEEEYGDQLDLVIGDTGTFETLIGVFEVTLHGAELLGAEGEYDGNEVQLDDFIKMELTVKNISDETYSVDDFLETLEVTEKLDGSGYRLYGKEVFDSIEGDISGDLEPGEEITGECIAEVYEAEEYYLRRVSGNTAAGDTNEVIFTMQADEVQ